MQLCAHCLKVAGIIHKMSASKGVAATISGCLGRLYLSSVHQTGRCTTAQVYELDGPDLKSVRETEKKHAFKCGTFGASSLAERRLATGNFGGELQVSSRRTGLRCCARVTPGILPS